MKIILIAFIVFSFFIDSGGPIGIRNISLLLIVLYSSWYVYKYIYCYSNALHHTRGFTVSFLLFCVFYLFFIFFGFLSASINQIAIGESIKWLLPLLFYFAFVLFFICFKFDTLIKGVCLGGLFFALVILGVFFAAVFMPLTLGNAFFELLSFMPGWFYYRQGGLIHNYPNIYFQATLCLTSFAVISYVYGYKKITLFILIALGASLSRSGVVIAVMIVIMISIFGDKYLNNISSIIQVVFLLFTPIIIVTEIIVFFNFHEGYTHSYNGLNIRIGHVISVVSEWNEYNFLYGLGPGSYFYSIGVEKFVDNIEVSQVEMLRKYGFIGSMLFHLSLFFYFNWLKEFKEYKLIFVVFAFYIISFTNPVLMTFLFSMLLAITTAITIKTPDRKRKMQII